MVNENYEIPKSVQESYYRWLSSHVSLGHVTVQQFASIYRWGIRDAIQSTAILSPQFEALQRLVDFAIGKPDHSESDNLPEKTSS